VTTGSLPVLRPAEVVARVEALGFVEVRRRGSHKQFRHPDGRGTAVPFPEGRDLSPILLRKIARDIGVTAEEFAAEGG
jgi:predicted RNA binding protein YcfA (HicA-like mRNA interferase family)